MANTISKVPAGITLAQIVRYGKLDNAIKKAGKEHKTLNALIKQVFKKPGTFNYGSVIITRSSADNFDATAAEEKFPQSKYPQYYKSVFDPSTLPADVKKTFVSKTERLSVQVVEDDSEE